MVPVADDGGRFFQKPHVDHVRPRLRKLGGNERVPDLRRYTVGELKELIGDAVPEPGFIQPKQVRYGSFPPRSVSSKSVRYERYTTALPKDGQRGDVCLYTPAPNVVWTMVCGDEIGSTHMRWFNQSGTYIFARNATPQAISTTGFTSVNLSAPLGPYAGLWQTRFNGNFDNQGTAAVHDIYLYLTRNVGMIAVEIMVGSLVAAWDRPTISSEIEHPGSAGGTIELSARGFAGTPRIISRRLATTALYLDVPA